MSVMPKIATIKESRGSALVHYNITVKINASVKKLLEEYESKQAEKSRKLLKFKETQ